MGELRVMGQKGDTRVMWNPDNPDEVKEAKRSFDNLVKKKGYRAYRVKKKGDAGEQITEFDPSAAKLIIAAPMAGGT
jgi:hypothetical protein